MKDYLITTVRAAATPVEARNIIREYLQARILGALQQAGAMIPLAFHGGTALRFLYGIARYSEDLDFALEGDPREYDFRRSLRAVESEFIRESYAVALKVSDKKTAHSAFVRFPGLLYELGVSPHRDETIAVKIEVDTRPPVGATTDTTVVRRFVLLQLHHHDRASLLAGKLHAVLQRPYPKGRDMYDLLWYLSDRDWPPPNLVMLNNALKQTDWAGPALTHATWREAVSAKVGSLNWRDVLADVRPFLQHSEDIAMLTQENVVRVLG